MANNYGTQPLTGVSKVKTIQHGVSALMAPVGEDGSFIKKGHAINDATKSGKQLGAMMIRKNADTYGIIIAQGSKEDAKWDVVNIEKQVTPA